MASLVSRVRTTAGTRRSNGYKHSKNSKNTTRKAASAIRRIFAELDKPKGPIVYYVPGGGGGGGGGGFQKSVVLQN